MPQSGPKCNNLHLLYIISMTFLRKKVPNLQFIKKNQQNQTTIIKNIKDNANKLRIYIILKVEFKKLHCKVTLL